MSKKKIYISIPINDCERWSKDEAKKAQHHYTGLGFEVYNPHELLSQYRRTLKYKPTEFQELVFTIGYLSKSDIMVLFPEYARSFRCITEIALANKYKIPIIKVYSGGLQVVGSACFEIFNTVKEPPHVLLAPKFSVN